MLKIRRVGSIGRTYRHAQRYRQILGLLLKYGYRDVLKTLRLDRYVERGLRRLAGGDLEVLSRGERFRRILEELGPTFVKAGQLLSTRPDLLPVDLLQELARLQDQVPPFPAAEARRIVEEELGAPIDQIFERFDEEPIAAASIAQVHRARLITDEEVVVKIRRPRVRALLEVDLEILLYLAGLLERHVEGAAVHRPTRVVEELALLLDKELDFLQEAANQERFAWQFAGDSRVKVPHVERSFSTAAVLVEEYVEGVKSSAVPELRARGLEPRRIAAAVARSTMQQLFVYGFFHADPHPGNLLVLDKGVLAYLDFGMMGRIDRRQRETFADLLGAMVQREQDQLADALIRLCTVPDREELDRRTLERELAEFTDRYFFLPLRDLRLGEALQQLVEIAARHLMSIPPDLFLMIKTLANAEGVCRTLDPNFEITAHAAPFLRRIHTDRLRPDRLLDVVTEGGTDLLRLGREIPAEMAEVLRRVRQGKARLGFEHLGLEPLVSTYDRASNRISFAIVLAALIVGSSIMVLAGVPPLFYDIPFLGLVGFVIAALMGFWLLVSILRHGRM